MKNSTTTKHSKKLGTFLLKKQSKNKPKHGRPDYCEDPAPYIWQGTL